MRLSKFTLNALVVGVLTTGTAIAATEVQPIGTGRTDHQLMYEVIEDGLSALGYETEEMLTGAYPAIHLSIGQGDAHYTAVHWKPLHNEYYANSGGDDVFVRAGPTYTDAIGIKQCFHLWRFQLLK